ncbi:MAG: C39 family peptidase [Candidatus Andersenbacteria bacterium]|nr:C39 family peptidase [Candidatus Andersenbacteria bacterium]
MRQILVFIVAVSLTVGATLAPRVLHADSMRLPITFHRQEHSLSCEIATLKMVLGIHGIDVAEAELIAKLPFDLTPRDSGRWGNPNKGFVGNIDGRMLVDGYGVYWDPIARIGAQYAETTVLEDGSPQELAQHVAAGNPVIIWGYYGQRKAYSWLTPDGTPIKA